jgi:branched-chain amino acid transport system substrate-binding protein
VNHRFGRDALWAGALATALLVGACSSSGNNASSSGGSGAKGSYVVADDDELSGPFAAYGNYTLTFIRAAVDYVNKHGGLNGHQVNLVTGDNAATGQNPISAAQQLLNSDNVNAIVGLTVSADCGQVAQLAAARKIPELCFSTPSSSLTTVQPYTYAGGLNNNQAGKPAVAFASGALKFGAGTKYAIYGTNVAGDVAFLNATTKYANAAGMHQTAREEVPVTAANGDTEIAQLVASKPQVVFAYPNEPQIQPLVRALRAAGNKAPVILAPGAASYPDIIALADPNVYALTDTEYVTDLGTTESGAAILVKAMTADGQGSPSDINQLLGDVAFPQIWAVLQGLKACGYPCSGSQLEATLDKTSIQMPGLFSGSFGWTATSHVPYSSMYVSTYDSSTKQLKVVANLPAGGVND